MVRWDGSRVLAIALLCLCMCDGDDVGNRMLWVGMDRVCIWYWGNLIKIEKERHLGFLFLPGSHILNHICRGQDQHMSFSVRYADLGAYFQAQFHRDPLVFHYYLAELKVLVYHSLPLFFLWPEQETHRLFANPAGLLPVASAALMSVQVPSCPPSCNLQYDLNSRCCVHLAYRLGHYNLKVIVVANWRKKPFCSDIPVFRGRATAKVFQTD